MKETQLFINGEFLDNGDREMRENINPATEEVISLFPVATEEDVAAAVDAAYEAQKSWEKVPPIERAGYLMELVQLLKENQELMARTNSEEMGKPLKQSMDEAGWLPAYLQYFAALARHMKGEIIPSDRPNENILIYKMPIGVAGQIMPWNFPLFLIGRKVAPALIAGCTVVLKASSDCPVILSMKSTFETGEPLRVFAHYTNPDNIKDGALQILPGSGMLCQRSGRARSAVFESYYGDSQGVEVSAHWCNLETVGIVSCITASGIDNLNGMCLQLMREVPFDVGLALVLLTVRHLAFRPDTFLFVTGAVFVRSEAVHKFLLRLDGPEISHLCHKLDGPLEAECSMGLVGIEMEFCGYFHPSQLPVNLCGTIGGVRIFAAMVKADGASLRIKLKD